MTEIAKLGRELGFQAKIETEKEPEYTSDNDYDDDIPESKQSNHARRVTCQARENPKYTEVESTNRYNETGTCNYSQRNQVDEGTIPAKDIIRTKKPISGQDDIGVEEFIKIVKKAKLRCSQQALLLDYIIAEKTINHAEKAIRYTQINSYTDLFNTLRQNFTQIGSVSALRSKLESCKQGPTETIQNFNLKFRQGVNELKYAVQSEHPGPMERKIAINIEEKESTKRYFLNLRREIGLQVKAQKPINLSEAKLSATNKTVRSTTKFSSCDFNRINK